MREAFTIIFIGLIAALSFCAIIARRSGKTMGSAVSFFLISLIPPVIGNLIIIICNCSAPCDSGC